ncbi:MAG: Na+-transporting NADH:ubiquinone oxidoreductase subunit [Anaerocolumna sp.]|jgi:RnfABCDGE-type electron transport complex D subunit|nr:Na+-transporting NADH:ubiquinone oxidoreductase subunit [Anaerocolumna sp.]
MFNVSVSPHVKSNTTTATIMRDVAIALVPSGLFGVYNFGIKALLIIITCITTSVLTEYLYEKWMKKPLTTGDFSALVTGLLLGLNLSPTVPLWIPIIGSVFAIVVVKMLYGGIGQNFMNPALAARCFLLISFAGRMNSFTIDGVTTATPLTIIRSGGEVDILSMFIGTTAGSIGETSVIAVLIGAGYLLIRKVISYRIPIFYIGTFAIFVLIFGGKSFDVNYLASQIFGGGLMLGAFFMATDYSTSPITRKGHIVYGIILGLLTGIFRVFGASPEGVSYAILFGNLLVPLIEKVTMPNMFGKGEKARG